MNSPEPIQHPGLFRITRLGVAGESPGRIRGLEQSGDLRRTVGGREVLNEYKDGEVTVNNGTMYDLNDLVSGLRSGVHLEQATGINDMAGLSRTEATTRPICLEPMNTVTTTPEPASPILSAIGVGMMAVGAVRRKRTRRNRSFDSAGESEGILPLESVNLYKGSLNAGAPRLKVLRLCGGLLFGILLLDLRASGYGDAITFTGTLSSDGSTVGSGDPVITDPATINIGDPFSILLNYNPASFALSGSSYILTDASASVKFDGYSFGYASAAGNYIEFATPGRVRSGHRIVSHVLVCRRMRF